jgi:hypothetical protein
MGLPNIVGPTEVYLGFFKIILSILYVKCPHRFFLPVVSKETRRFLMRWLASIIYNAFTLIKFFHSDLKLQRRSDEFIIGRLPR